MKNIRFLLLWSVFPLITLFYSCGGDDELGVEDTFTVDTLIVNPFTGIDEQFTVGWAVTTEGFPTYFVDIYYSEDMELDITDVKIGATSSVDAFEELNKADETQYFRIENGPTSGLVIFRHNEDTPNSSDAGWVNSSPLLDPAGNTAYIIGYFYHAQGLQIIVARNKISIPVTFE